MDSLWICDSGIVGGGILHLRPKFLSGPVVGCGFCIELAELSTKLVDDSNYIGIPEFKRRFYL